MNSKLNTDELFGDSEMFLMREGSSLRAKQKVLNDAIDQDPEADLINDILSEIADNWIDYRDLSPDYLYFFSVTEQINA